jgi:hypothetical protein
MHTLGYSMVAIFCSLFWFAVGVAVGGALCSP